MKTFIVDSIIIVGLFGFSNEKEMLVKEDDSKTIFAYVENVEALNESYHLINAYVEGIDNIENTKEKPLEDYQFILPKYIFEL